MPRSQDSINSDLRTRTATESEFQKKVVSEVRSYMKVSCEAMHHLWQSWDQHDQIYRGYRIRDRDDARAINEKEPPKIIVPITYAQIQTALSFLLATFSQRDNIYELRGRGPEDRLPALNMEYDLEYQMEQSQMLLRLYCWSLDALKMGFGVVKINWEEERTKVRTGEFRSPDTFGNKARGLIGLEPVGEKVLVESVQDILKYQGNKITNVSPYNFYPDPDVALADFQNGAFVGHEEEVSRAVLMSQEGIKYHGIDKIGNFVEKVVFDYRKRRVGQRWGEISGKSIHGVKHVESVIFTEMMFNIVPKEWTEKFGIDFGSETYPIKFIAAIGNDTKLVRFEPSGYLHGMYNYAMFEASPDHSSSYNVGLADTVYSLQNMITWFINAHVANVRKVIRNQFITNEEKIYVQDITDGGPVIRTKPGVAVNDIDRVIKQLKVEDVTRNHVGDADSLAKLVQLVTGISDNALGQYHTGRRSATESRNVNAGSASRLKMMALTMWQQGIKPCGEQILANTRQGRTREVYDMILGDKAQDHPYEEVVLTDPNKIAGGYDFVPYDATLPTEKFQQGNMLTEIFKILMGGPEIMQLLNKNPLKLLNHIAELYGIKNLRDFDLSNDQPLGGPPQVQVVPDGVAQQAAEGGAQPVDINPLDAIASAAA